jgi:putative SOS response-associated peptidase YedK
MTLAAQFGLAGIPRWTPRCTIAPTQEVLAVAKMPDASYRQAHLLRWGLIPPWAEGPAVGSRMINARAETVATRPPPDDQGGPHVRRAAPGCILR